MYTSMYIKCINLYYKINFFTVNIYIETFTINIFNNILL